MNHTKIYNNCPYTGKRMFATKGEATEIIKRPKVPPMFDGKRVKRGVKKREEKRAFLCEDCQHWHLTSQEHKRKFKKNKRRYDG